MKRKRKTKRQIARNGNVHECFNHLITASRARDTAEQFATFKQLPTTTTLRKRKKKTHSLVGPPELEEKSKCPCSLPLLAVNTSDEIFTTTPPLQCEWPKMIGGDRNRPASCLSSLDTRCCFHIGVAMSPSDFWSQLQAAACACVAAFYGRQSRCFDREKNSGRRERIRACMKRVTVPVSSSGSFFFFCCYIWL